MKNVESSHDDELAKEMGRKERRESFHGGNSYEIHPALQAGSGEQVR